MIKDLVYGLALALMVVIVLHSVIKAVFLP